MEEAVVVEAVAVAAPVGVAGAAVADVVAVAAAVARKGGSRVGLGRALWMEQESMGLASKLWPQQGAQPLPPPQTIQIGCRAHRTERLAEQRRRPLASRPPVAQCPLEDVLTV